MDNDSRWERNRKATIKQDMKSRDDELQQSIARRLSETFCMPFFHLSIDEKLRDAYSKKHAISQMNEATLTQESTGSGDSYGASHLWTLL